MEGAKLIRDLLQENDWMVCIDLKDAYLSVPIAQEHRELLRFAWEDQLFEFQCLPFGLSSAPRTFTKLLKSIMSLLRQKGIRVIRSMIFLDDMLIMAQSLKELKELTQEVLQLLQLLGFRIICGKSVLKPKQIIQYLGFIMNSVSMVISPPDDKVNHLVQACSKAIHQGKLSVQELSMLIGRMTATMMAVLPAPLCYKNLQRLKNQAFQHSQSFGTVVQLDQCVKDELEWWMWELKTWTGRQILPPLPDITLETDASLLGWGGCYHWRKDRWSVDGKGTNATHQLLGADGECICGEDICKEHAECPHSSSYGQQNSGILHQLHGTNQISNSVPRCWSPSSWQWFLQRGITLSRVPARIKQYSRRQGISHSTIIRRMEIGRGNMPADLSEVRPMSWSSRSVCIETESPAERIVSWHPDPFAMATDAFQISWKGLLGYTFPPFSLIGKCLQKVRREECTVVLVAPVWYTQPWYPALLELLVNLPVLLPGHEGLLRDPFNRIHPLLARKQLQLAVWRISGDSIAQKAFQRVFPNSYWRGGAREHVLPTSLAGRSGVAGVLQGRPIPFHVMSTSSSTS